MSNSTNQSLTAEGKKYISLIELAQASGNAKEVYSLANQLIQSDFEAPEGYYYKAITTTSMKEGWVLAERLVKIAPQEAKHYLDVAENLGRLYADAYQSKVKSIMLDIKLAHDLQGSANVLGKRNEQWDKVKVKWKEFVSYAEAVLEGYAKCISFLDSLTKKENPSNSLSFSEEDTKKANEMAKNLIRQIISVITYCLDGVETGNCHPNDCYENIILCDEKQKNSLQEYYAKYINYFGDFSIEDCLAACKNAKRPENARFFCEQAIKLHPSEYRSYCTGVERVAELYLKEFQTENATIDSLADVEREKLGTDEDENWYEVEELWNKFAKRGIDKIDKIGDCAMCLPPLLSQNDFSAEEKKSIESARMNVAEKIDEMASVLTEGCKKTIFSAIHCTKEDMAALKAVLDKYSSLGFKAEIKEKKKKKGGCLSTIFKFILFIILIIIVIIIVAAVVGSQGK